MTGDAPHPLVLVLEDDPAIRTLLNRVLARDHRLVFVGTGAELKRRLGAGDASLVLLDILLPGENGIEIAMAIRATSAVPLVLISGLHEAGTIAAGLNIGADDYVTKPFDPLVLRARVHNAIRRHGADVPASTPEVVHFAGCVTQPMQRRIRHEEGREVALTEKEFQLFMALARHAGQVVDRDELSRLLSGSEWSPLNRVLDVHVSNLRKKLRAVTGMDDILASRRGRGYQLSIDTMIGA